MCLFCFHHQFRLKVLIDWIVFHWTCSDQHILWLCLFTFHIVDQLDFIHTRPILKYIQ